uniref:Uncharacterized protein n=1 Tax=Anguilla anguilla TaxID=7936 RepID=A0A0E9WP45_ANGAN
MFIYNAQPSTAVTIIIHSSFYPQITFFFAKTHILYQIWGILFPK